MARKQNRYREMERILTIALIADAAVFLLYLLAAGFGVIWLKVITAIVAIVGSGLCLALLYFSGELLRPPAESLDECRVCCGCGLPACLPASQLPQSQQSQSHGEN